MVETLCLFDAEADAETLYQPPADRLTVVDGDIADVAGLSYEPEFITAGEERVLLWHADRGVWSDFWTRRTQFYGIRYERSALQIDPSTDAREPVPGWCDAIRRRLVEHGIMHHMANQIGINEYLPGQGIAGHVDYFGGMVVSLSLASGCVMDITEPLTRRSVSVWLAPRSILVLQGEARNVWEHGIARRQKDFVNGHPIRRCRRVSITFRDVEGGTVAESQKSTLLTGSVLHK